MVFENQRKLPSFLSKKDDVSLSKCQKCLETGHWTFECKNKRVFLDRKTKCDELKEIDKRQEEPKYIEQPNSSSSDSDSSSDSEGSSSSSSSSNNSSSSSSDSSSSDSEDEIPQKKLKISNKTPKA